MANFSEQTEARVKIQRRGGGKDALNQPLTDDWDDVASVWAWIVPLTGIETIKADVPTSTIRASIRIRYRDGIDAGMRVLHGATVYEIQAVLVAKRHVDLVCETSNA